MTGEQAFDHDWQLDELLEAREFTALGKELEALLAAPLGIEDAQGRLLSGSPQTAMASRHPLILELDPAGYLASPAEPTRLAHAAVLLQFILRTRLRFRMAASLHQESTAEDYAELRRTHTRVLESEARYRKLAGELENRVREQVTELENRQQQLFQAARLATVGQLAAGVAHEMNTPLGFVRSNLVTLSSYLQRLEELRSPDAISPALRQKLDLDFTLEDAGEILRECRDGLDRIALIVRELKTFSTVDMSEQSQCDLNACLQQAANLFDGQLPEGVSLALDLAPGLPAIPGIAGHLNQAFLNLMRNAARAIADKGGPGTIRISTRRLENHLELRVQDDGIGMNESVLQQAFNPFFTTLPVGSGAGLGLSSARSIVLAHGGQISLASQPGAGTTVTIQLPLP